MQLSQLLSSDYKKSLQQIFSCDQVGDTEMFSFVATTVDSWHDIKVYFWKPIVI